MTFYTDMQGVASTLLTQFDQGGIVISVATPGGGPVYNPGATTYADTAVVGVVAGISADYLLKDSLVQNSDLQVTFPGGILVPKLSDIVKINGVAYTTIRVISKPADGVVAAFTMIVRK